MKVLVMTPSGVEWEGELKSSHIINGVERSTIIRQGDGKLFIVNSKRVRPSGEEVSNLIKVLICGVGFGTFAALFIYIMGRYFILLSMHS